MTIEERFWAKVSPEPNTGCWLWDANWIWGGYGMFRVGKQMTLAHRFSYELHNGEIPNGLDLDHLCRVRCCVNPDHLEPVTRTENVQRGAALGTYGAANRRKTQCPRGHSLEGDNLYIDKKHSRSCKACRRAANRQWRTSNQQVVAL